MASYERNEIIGYCVGEGKAMIDDCEFYCSTGCYYETHPGEKITEDMVLTGDNNGFDRTLFCDQCGELICE